MPLFERTPWCNKVIFAVIVVAICVSTLFILPLGSLRQTLIGLRQTLIAGGGNQDGLEQLAAATLTPDALTLVQPVNDSAVAPTSTEPTSDPTAVPSLTTGSSQYFFLDSGWEQFNAGRNTFHDYSMISSLVGRTPVIPFVGSGSDTYLGHPDHPGASSMTLTDIVDIVEPVVAFARYERAMDECGDRIGLVHINHRSNDDGGNSEVCPQGPSKEYTRLTDAEALWGASVAFRLCTNSHEINIDLISESPALCLVLQNFHGLWNHRGELKLSEAATMRMSRYKHIQTIVAHYRVPWSNAWVSSSHNLIPDTSPIVKASSCAWSSSNNSTGILGQFDAVQFRLEGLLLKAEKVAPGISAEEKMSFFENCVNRTVGEVLAARKNTTQVHGEFSNLPLYVITDIGSVRVGPDGHRYRLHGGSKTIGGQRISFPALFQRLTQLLGVLGEVTFSSDCDTQCSGPTCFFKDAAFFMLAELGVSIWTGGNSQGQMKRVRASAGKETLLVHPDFASLTRTQT